MPRPSTRHFAVALAGLIVFAPAMHASQVDTTAPLAARDMSWPPVVVDSLEPVNFDLLDVRADERTNEQQRAGAQIDREPHSLFVIKRHIGLSGGYDQNIAHGSVGFYLTVAEWGRWNFGIPAVEFGFGRYPSYDESAQRVDWEDRPTVMLSLASVHYRVGYIQSLGAYWYINFERVHDVRFGLQGSQVGVSISRQ